MTTIRFEAEVIEVSPHGVSILRDARDGTSTREMLVPATMEEQRAAGGALYRRVLVTVQLLEATPRPSEEGER